MPQLSILVPAVGGQTALEDTLISVLENRPPSCEVMLICEPGFPDPYDLQDEVRFVHASGEWRSMLNEGIRAARGNVVHSLFPGVLATPHWTTAAVERLAAAPPHMLGVAPTITNVHNAATFCGVSLSAAGRRSRIEDASPQLPIGPLAPSWHGGFFRTHLLRQMGGWNSRIVAELADIELALRAEANGWDVVQVNGSHLLDTHRSDRPSFGESSEFRIARDTTRLQRTYFVEDSQPFPRLGAMLLHTLSDLPHPSRWVGRLAGRFGPPINDPQPLPHPEARQRAA